MYREPLSTIRQLELMRDLQRLANERHDEEVRLQEELTLQLRTAREELDGRAQQIDQQWDQIRRQAEETCESRRGATQERYQTQRENAQVEYKGLRSGVESQHSNTTRTALSEQQDAAWQAWTVFEAEKDRPRKRLTEAFQRLRQSGQELAVLEHDALAIVRMRRMAHAVASAGDAPAAMDAARVHGANGHSQASAAAEAAATNVERLTKQVRQETLRLYHQSLPRLFESWHPLGLAFLVWVMAAIPCGMVMNWTNWLWAVTSGLIAIVAALAILAWLYPFARQRTAAQYAAVQRTLATARGAIERAAREARQRGYQEAAEVLQNRDAKLDELDHEFRSTVEEHNRLRESEMESANARFPALLAQLRKDHEAELQQAELSLRQTLSDATQRRDDALATSQSEYDQRCGEVRSQYERDWKAMADQWLAGLARLQDSRVDMHEHCQRLFPDWNVTRFASWEIPQQVPAAIQFGRIAFDLAHVKHGRPADERLLPKDTNINLPALMNLQEHPALLLTADGPGRDRAINLLELMVLRLLTAVPPGKLRLTILDPVGLGENFASFMHLADYDERLIASRIWTESKDINEQLVRLTAHMETILQKYLRNEFATIHEYNEQAGEVAEPIQVLVVANFPANFTEETARRLTSIVTSGPRCGVYTLMSVDQHRRMPNDFHLQDLFANAVHLDWQSDGQHFVWQYPAYERLALTLDEPPPADRFLEVVRDAGKAAQTAMRVEVPFAVVAPGEDEVWAHECSSELVVPVGRAGATRLQSVRLGKGTSQHVLICGKTGSGKSTFLHALVTNAALHYSPDEVEFYLVDFKKGVEFKCYATGNLPHARVIAIESEREFGLSVLEKLDSELRRRGDWFRAIGVQDLAGFRAVRPAESMPRVLLIVDEFQELFVEDDKLAQDAGLLLDRLVRQGRAFGMHVLLGSQSLSGAYSLNRSTMGQMAVRVALQCSEADAHLILSDDRNTAARYLSRPGEAIYNDQNGLVTGNSPFQVVWLGEQERFNRLAQISELQETRDQAVSPPIVFEGNSPADPAENSQLAKLLAAPSMCESSSPQEAWLGAAVAITEPTCATFARHAGSNLIVVGHREEAAMGVVTSAVISLAAQHGVRSRSRESGVAGQGQEVDQPLEYDSGNPQSTILVLDGTRADSLEAGVWSRVADALSGIVKVKGLRETSDLINEVSEELARRESSAAEDSPPWYLVIFNGGRFRELRRSDDDFGFSVDHDKPPRPDHQLAEVLRNGPAWGIHTIVWCDSYNNVMRMFDRMTLREFEMRVAFQMSAADSSSLLDSPAASRLRVHRGLFYSDETGMIEKFRPYGPPTNEWLAVVKTELQVG